MSSPPYRGGASSPDSVRAFSTRDISSPSTSLLIAENRARQEELAALTRRVTAAAAAIAAGGPSSPPSLISPASPPLAPATSSLSPQYGGYINTTGSPTYSLAASAARAEVEALLAAAANDRVTSDLASRTALQGALRERDEALAESARATAHAVAVYADRRSRDESSDLTRTRAAALSAELARVREAARIEEAALHAALAGARQAEAVTAAAAAGAKAEIAAAAAAKIVLLEAAALATITSASAASLARASLAAAQAETADEAERGESEQRRASTAIARANLEADDARAAADALFASLADERLRSAAAVRSIEGRAAEERATATNERTRLEVCLAGAALASETAFRSAADARSAAVASDAARAEAEHRVRTVVAEADAVRALAAAAQMELSALRADAAEAQERANAASERFAALNATVTSDSALVDAKLHIATLRAAFKHVSSQLAAAQAAKAPVEARADKAEA